MSPNRFFVLGFGALAVFDTLTQVSFKLAAGRAGEFTMASSWFRAAATSPWLYVAILGYLGAFFTWMTLLERVAVGPAFAASHLDIVAVLLISGPLFGERLQPLQLVGAVCIIAGIVLLSVTESRRAEPATSR